MSEWDAWRILGKLKSIESFWKPGEECGWISQIENVILKSICVVWGLHLNGPNHCLVSLYPPTVNCASTFCHSCLYASSKKCDCSVNLVRSEDKETAALVSRDGFFFYPGELGDALVSRDVFLS